MTGQRSGMPGALPPYPVALAAAGDRAAWLASIVTTAAGRRLRVARHDAGGERCLYETDQLHGLSLVGRPERLAVLGSDRLRLFGAGRAGEPAVLPLSGVSGLHFDAAGDAWLLRGTDLMRVGHDRPDAARPVAAGVVAFARHRDGLAWVERRPDDAFTLVLAEGAGTPRRIEGGRLPAGPGWRFDLCIDERIAALLARPALHAGGRDRQLWRFDLKQDAWLAPLALPALCHLGVRDAALHGWVGGQRLCLVERGGAMRLVRLCPEGGDDAEVLSPPHHDVQELHAEPGADVLAYSFVDLAPGAGPQRALAVARGLASGVAHWRRHDDVAAAFAVDGRAVHLLQRTPAGLTLSVDDGGAALHGLAGWPPGPANAPAFRRLGAAGEWQAEGSPARGRPLVAVVPGLHKLVTPHLQTLYLQEFLAEVAASLAPHGIDACLLQLPGSAGRGSAWRGEVGLHDLAGLAAGTRTAIDRLAAAAAAPVGLLSASLGALALVRALERPGAAVACALLAPVFSAAAIGLPDGEAEAPPQPPAPAGPASRFLLLHGTRDEVAPFAASERFAAQGAAGERRLLALPGEGHIPSAAHHWELAAEAITEFFLSTLIHHDHT